MAKESFSLQVMSLKFGQQSLGFILFGCFVLGILLGVLSMIHIDNPGASSIITMPLFWAAIIPISFIVRGIQKAEMVSGS